MRLLKEMSRGGRSLLLYLEARAVDFGHVDGTKMNAEDFGIVKKWSEEGFVQFGRIASEHITKGRHYWVVLSEEAWKLAHEERRTRAKRVWEKRRWTTTDEKRKRGLVSAT